MRLYSEFLGEDAGDKFRAMSDSQFDGWKKANPGAADKADQLRGGKKAPGTAAKKVGGAITKGVDLVQQRKQQQQVKSDLAKRQAQEKQAEAKSDREEKSSLAKQQQKERQAAQKVAQKEKQEAQKEKSKAPKQGDLGVPGKGVVDSMKKKVKPSKSSKVSGGGPNRLAQAGKFIKKKVGQGVNLAKKLASQSDAARGIGGAPGDLKGLPSRSNNL